MLLRWMVAAVHLLALGIGLGAVWARAGALRSALDREGLARAFRADTWWGVAAILWIGTGLARAFGGLEKGAPYYMHNGLFMAKMTCLLAVLVLEVWPMTTLIRWRIGVARGDAVDTRAGLALARVSTVQALLVVLMVVAATGMARGYGAIGR